MRVASPPPPPPTTTAKITARNGALQLTAGWTGVASIMGTLRLHPPRNVDTTACERALLSPQGPSEIGRIFLGHILDLESLARSSGRRCNPRYLSNRRCMLSASSGIIWGWEGRRPRAWVPEESSLAGRKHHYTLVECEMRFSRTPGHDAEALGRAPKCPGPGGGRRAEAEGSRATRLEDKKTETPPPPNTPLILIADPPPIPHTNALMATGVLRDTLLLFPSDGRRCSPDAAR